MNGIVLTHGAGTNADAPLLVSLAEAFEAAGWRALRYNLPYRQARPKGPPFPAGAAADRAGIAAAAAEMRERVDGIVAVAGHSYGGRMASMVAAQEPEGSPEDKRPKLIDALLLLGYPLRPPRKPDQLRVGHFPDLYTPTMFVHGTRDPFGSIEQLTAAVALIQRPVQIVPVERAGHELKGLDAAAIVAAFERMLACA